jgi:acyl-CoA synthetase (NDP forming)
MAFDVQRAAGMPHGALTAQPTTGEGDLGAFLAPRSVAVIGASADQSKVGNVLLRNLKAAACVEHLYPINAKHARIEGLECFPSVSDVPGSIDLAVVALPATAVPEAVEECVARGVAAVLVVSSGFSETGPEGRGLERRIRAAIAGTSTRLLGPNTLGYYVPSQDLDVVFLERGTFPRPPAGHIGIVSQSGSLGVDFMFELSSAGSGISMFLGLGNKLDVDECDVLGQLAGDDDTRSIALYIESITDGPRFLEACQRVVDRKPLVLLKGGRSRGGGKATALHTGRMGGRYSVLKGVMDQLGVIEARDEVELIDLARGLAALPAPKGGRVLVITNGGGNGIVAIDLLEGEWPDVLRMAELPDAFREELKGMLPDFISPGNPLDLSSQATDREYVKALRLAIKHDVADIYVLGVTASERLTGSLVEGVAELSRRASVPVVAYCKGNGEGSTMARFLSGAGVPAYPSVHRAATVAGAFARYHSRRDRTTSEGGA